MFRKLLALAMVPALGLCFLVGTSFAQNEGLPKLDEAAQLSRNAKSLDDLNKIIQLTNQAAKEGLDTDSAALAKRIYHATIMRRGQELAKSLMQGRVPAAQSKAAYTIATRDLTSTLKVAPNSQEVLLLLIQLQARIKEDQDKAKAHLASLFKLRAEDPLKLADAYVLRARLGLEPETRLDDLNKAVELAPKSAGVLTTRATFFASEKKFAEALADMQSVCKIQPDNINAILGCAELNTNMKKLDEARKLLDEAIILDKDNARSFVMRAQLNALDNKTDDALTDLDSAIKLEPKHLAARMMRARGYQLKGELDKALEDIDYVIEQNPTAADGAILERSKVLAAQKKFAEAILVVKQLIQKNPKNEMLQGFLANFLLADKQIQKGIEQFTKILHQNPKSIGAFRGRGDAYLSIGDQTSAVADYEAALKIQPKFVVVINNLAWVLATGKDDSVRDGKRALELAKQALEIVGKEQPHLLSTLAASYAEIGDFEKAVEKSTSAVETSEGKLKEQLSKELASYKEKKPWRELKKTEQKVVKQPGIDTSDLE